MEFDQANRQNFRQKISSSLGEHFQNFCPTKPMAETHRVMGAFWGILPSFLPRAGALTITFLLKFKNLVCKINTGNHIDTKEAPQNSRN